MTNVLIPTDFTVQSIDAIGAAAQHIPDRANFFLFHAFDMPQSLIDAMRLTGVKSHHNLVTEELRLRCRQVKEENLNIAGISFRLMFGSTVSVFRNFAEANKINLIVYPEDYVFLPTVRESVDPCKMFLKSQIPLMRTVVPLLKGHNASDRQLLGRDQRMALQ